MTQGHMETATNEHIETAYANLREALMLVERSRTYADVEGQHCMRKADVYSAVYHMSMADDDSTAANACADHEQLSHVNALDLAIATIHEYVMDVWGMRDADDDMTHNETMIAWHMREDLVILRANYVA